MTDPGKRSESLRRYWRTNLKILAVLLTVWAVAGLGCGVLWADWLNAWRLPGTAYPMGFWFAQQGSIIVFVVVIFVYCVLMNRLDARHHAELEAFKDAEGGDGGDGGGGAAGADTSDNGGAKR